MALPPSTDEKGHASALTVRIPPNWVAQIDRVVKDRSSEFLNRGDFIRQAIYSYFSIVHAQRENPTGNTAMLHALEVLMEEERLQVRGEKVIKRLHKIVQMYMDKGAGQEALRLILLTLDGVRNMEPGYWQDSFAGEIKERYAGLLSGAKGVDIFGGSDGN